MDALILQKPIIYLGSPVRPQEGDPGWPLIAGLVDADEAYRVALASNLEFAECACKLIALAGGVPYAPHLIFPRFFDDAKAEERNLSIGCGLRMISICDEAWFYIPPWRLALSGGMRGERDAAAKDIGIPTRVFHDRAAFEAALALLRAGKVNVRPLPGILRSAGADIGPEVLAATLRVAT